MLNRAGVFVLLTGLLVASAPQTAEARNAYTCRNRANKPAVKRLCHVLGQAANCRRKLGISAIAKRLKWTDRMRFQAAKVAPKRLWLKDSKVPGMLRYLKTLAPLVRDCLRATKKANRRASKEITKGMGLARRIADSKTFRKVERVYDKVANAVQAAREQIKRYVKRKIGVMVDYAKGYVKQALLKQLYRADRALRKKTRKLEKALRKIVHQAVKRATGLVLTKSRIKRISKGICRLPVIVSVVTTACSTVIGPAGFICAKACPWAVGKVISWGKRKFDKYLARKVAKIAMRYIKRYKNKAMQFAIRKVRAW